MSLNSGPWFNEDCILALDQFIQPASWVKLTERRVHVPHLSLSGFTLEREHSDMHVCFLEQDQAFRDFIWVYFSFIWEIADRSYAAFQTVFFSAYICHFESVSMFKLTSTCSAKQSKNVDAYWCTILTLAAVILATWDWSPGGYAVSAMVTKVPLLGACGSLIVALSYTHCVDFYCMLIY